MSVFSPVNLVVNENVDPVSINQYITLYEESYFIETLNFLSESRKEFNEYNKTFYKTVLESGNNQVIIHEAFSDFFSGIKKIIDKILDFISRLISKFITKLNALIGRESYLKKHKADFGKFGSNHEFTFNGYEFVFPANVPVLDVLMKFADSMEDFELSKNTHGTNYSDSAAEKNKTIATNLKAKYDKLVEDLDDKFYDKVRAEVIGKDGVVYQSDFSNELFSLFRNDSNSKEEITVNSSKVVEYYDRFDKYKTFETSVNKDKARIEKEYNSVKSQIDKASKRSADGKLISVDTGSGNAEYTFDRDVMSIIDLMIKAKANQIQEISNIHALAFSAKLDAIRECFKQDKSVLYQALYKIQGVKKEDN